MWTLLGIVVVAVVIGLFVLISPGAPARDFRNRKDGESAGWRSGGNVSWFHDTDRDDRLD